jgi:hypothetical protein
MTDESKCVLYECLMNGLRLIDSPRWTFSEERDVEAMIPSSISYRKLVTEVLPESFESEKRLALKSGVCKRRLRVSVSLVGPD